MEAYLTTPQRRPERVVVRMLVGSVAACTGAVFAAHPLQTEDTGTQGSGNVEIENGLSWTNSGGSRQFQYQPQLSYGLVQSVDLIVQPSWLISRDPGGAAVRGFGDTNLDAKWRFFGKAPLSVGVRFGVTAATSQQGLGERHGTLGSHALLVMTLDAAPLVFHANAGLNHASRSGDARASLAQVSGAVMWAANERLTWTVDAGAQSNPDRARHSWPGYALVGSIYTIRPGLDADLGYLTGVGAGPASREWLVGLTYRFAP